MSRLNHNLTRPTRRQKELIDRLRLNPDDWLICCESEHTITLYNKYTDKSITRIKKEFSVNEKF